jgi:hypothetical protein
MMWLPAGMSVVILASLIGGTASFIGCWIASKGLTGWLDGCGIARNHLRTRFCGEKTHVPLPVKIKGMLAQHFAPDETLVVARPQPSAKAPSYWALILKIRLAAGRLFAISQTVCNTRSVN